MEIIDKTKHGFIEVWLTNAEQKTVDRNELTHHLIMKTSPKNKIIFFLSGHDDLIACTENILIKNL